MSLLEEFRDAWPDGATIDEAQVTKLLAAFKPETVREVIADRLEAELPRPSLAELSRVLRAYQGTPSKDPEPEPTPAAPRRPWINDLDAAPPIPDDLPERLAELRALIGDETPTFIPPERFVADREAPKVVPKFVYEAAKQ